MKRMEREPKPRDWVPKTGISSGSSWLAQGGQHRRAHSKTPDYGAGQVRGGRAGIWERGKGSKGRPWKLGEPHRTYAERPEQDDTGLPTTRRKERAFQVPCERNLESGKGLRGRGKPKRTGQRKWQS